MVLTSKSLRLDGEGCKNLFGARADIFAQASLGKFGLRGASCRRRTRALGSLERDYRPQLFDGLCLAVVFVDENIVIKRVILNLFSGAVEPAAHGFVVHMLVLAAVFKA